MSDEAKRGRRALREEPGSRHDPPDQGEAAGAADSDQRRVCCGCGHVHDPAEGDPAGGVAAGTAFEELSADGRCPICYVGNDEFCAGPMPPWRDD